MAWPTWPRCPCHRAKSSGQLGTAVQTALQTVFCQRTKDVKGCQKGFQGISGLRWVLGIFDPCPKAQPDSYKSELLPADVPKMSVEAVT